MQIINTKSRMSSYTTVASIAMRQCLKVLTQEPFWPRFLKNARRRCQPGSSSFQTHTHTHRQWAKLKTLKPNHVWVEMLGHAISQGQEHTHTPHTHAQAMSKIKNTKNRPCASRNAHTQISQGQEHTQTHTHARMHAHMHIHNKQNRKC